MWQHDVNGMSAPAAGVRSHPVAALRAALRRRRDDRWQRVLDRNLAWIEQVHTAPTVAEELAAARRR